MTSPRCSCAQVMAAGSDRMLVQRLSVYVLDQSPSGLAHGERANRIKGTKADMAFSRPSERFCSMTIRQ
jgi:hypothetical protein